MKGTSRSRPPGGDSATVRDLKKKPDERVSVPPATRYTRQVLASFVLGLLTLYFKGPLLLGPSLQEWSRELFPQTGGDFESNDATIELRVPRLQRRTLRSVKRSEPTYEVFPNIPAQDDRAQIADPLFPTAYVEKWKNSWTTRNPGQYFALSSPKNWQQPGLGKLSFHLAWEGFLF